MKPEVREFLENLDKEDVNQLKASIKAYQRIQALAWWSKVIVVSALTIVVSISQFADSIKKIIVWLK